MRTAHVSDFYLPRLGGIETQLADLAWRQHASGHDVSIVTATGLDGSPPEQASSGRRLGEASVHRLGAAARLGLVPRWLPGTEDADVVHVHLGGVAPLGWSVLRNRAALGLPTVVTVHSVLDRLRLIQSTAGAVGGWRQAPFVWCGVSQRVADQLRELLGDEATIHVVPNAVDQDRWRPAGVRRASREEFLVVAALRHTRRKRAEVLPGVLAHMNEVIHAESGRRGTRPPRVRAVIVGTGNRSAAIHRAVRRESASAWIELPGRLTQAELRALYHRADAFVAPTVLESFGLGALEARAAGLPVVARSDSGSAEVLEHEREALLASSDAGLARSLARLAIDVPLRQRIADHNARTTLDFDWTTTLALTAHAYDTARQRVGTRAVPSVPSGSTRPAVLLDLP